MRCKSFLLGALLFFVSGFTVCAQVRIKNQIQLSNLETVLIFTVVDRADGQVGLRLRADSGKSEISNDTRILFRLSGGEVMELHGRLLDTRLYWDGDLSFSISFDDDDSLLSSDMDTWTVSEAEFVITEKDFSKLSKGIVKMRVNMIPEPYNKQWGQDKLGKQLVRAYDYAKRNGSRAIFKRPLYYASCYSHL